MAGSDAADDEPETRKPSPSRKLQIQTRHLVEQEEEPNSTRWEEEEEEQEQRQERQGVVDDDGSDAASRLI